MSKIWIGSAWPYANGDLHLGHIAGLIGGDILAKYYRLKGDQVCYVSGTDSHGSPIAIKANRHKTKPEIIAKHYHERFVKDFDFLNFEYDYYGATTDQHHKEVVKEVFKGLYDQGLINIIEQEQYYCSSCQLHLADRFLKGECPHCHKLTRSGQCEYCNSFVESHQLKTISCSLCGEKPSIIKVNQANLRLSEYQDDLRDYFNHNEKWRDNAKRFTKRYLDEGVKDKIITRSLDWGIDVPLEGFENQSIYVWFDAVIGYISATNQWELTNGDQAKNFLHSADRLYFIHGKDNIPFHTLIYPVVQKYDPLMKPVDSILSSEHLTFNGTKISTSSGHAPWVKDYRHIDSDSLRLYLVINGPETQDADFSDYEFERKYHHYLVDVLGNYYHRTLKFHTRFWGEKGELSPLSDKSQQEVISAFKVVSEAIEKGEFKHAIYQAFELVKWANKYYDELEPWKIRRENEEKCREVIGELLTLSINISMLLSPFLPNQWSYIKKIFALEGLDYGIYNTRKSIELKDVQPLYERRNNE